MASAGGEAASAGGKRKRRESCESGRTGESLSPAPHRSAGEKGIEDMRLGKEKAGEAGACLVVVEGSSGDKASRGEGEETACESSVEGVDRSEAVEVVDVCGRKGSAAGDGLEGGAYNATCTIDECSRTAAPAAHAFPDAVGMVENVPGGKARGRGEVKSGDAESPGSCESSMQEDRAPPPAAVASAPAGACPPEASEGADECCVCWAPDKSHTFVPCGHYCVCKGCADRIMAASKECPVCRQVSALCMKIYF